MKLGEPCDGMLLDFCAVVYGVDGTKVIREAVIEHITRRLDANQGLKTEYEAKRLQRLAAQNGKSGHIRSVD